MPHIKSPKRITRKEVEERLSTSRVRWYLEYTKYLWKIIDDLNEKVSSVEDEETPMYWVTEGGDRMHIPSTQYYIRYPDRKWQLSVDEEGRLYIMSLNLDISVKVDFTESQVILE